MRTSSTPRTRTAQTASHHRGWLSAGNLWLLSCLTLGALVAGWVVTRPAPAANRAAVSVTRTAAGEITVAPIDRKIEAAQVGMAAWSHNPTGEEDLQFGDHVDPATWKHLVLRSQKADGSYCDINLLRPDWWLEDEAAERGGTIYVSVPECGIDGDAEVLGIRPCPAIQPCPPGYRTITGTFHHQNAKVIDVHIEGLAEPIGTTPNHPFWSVDRQEFVRADTLATGDRVKSHVGNPQVLYSAHRETLSKVFNLEIQGTHAYFVSGSGILVHNGTICRGKWIPDRTDGLWTVYQGQVTGHFGKQYRFNGVDFDGYKRGKLLDAKGIGIDGILRGRTKGPDVAKAKLADLLRQAQRQAEAAKGTGRRIQWVFAEKGAADFMRRRLEEMGIEVIVKPMTF